MKSFVRLFNRKNLLAVLLVCFSGTGIAGFFISYSASANVEQSQIGQAVTSTADTSAKNQTGLMTALRPEVQWMRGGHLFNMAIDHAWDSDTMATMSNTEVKIWRTSDNTLLRTISKTSSAGQNKLSLNSNGQYLAFIDGTTTVRVYNLVSGALARTFNITDATDIYDIDLSPNGSDIAISFAPNNPKFRVYRVSDGVLLADKPVNEASYDVEYSWDNFIANYYLAAVDPTSFPNAVRLYNPNNNYALVRTIPGLGYQSLAFSKEGTYLAAGDAQNIRVVNTNGTNMTTLISSNNINPYLAFSPNNLNLVVTGIPINGNPSPDGGNIASFPIPAVGFPWTPTPLAQWNAESLGTGSLSIAFSNTSKLAVGGNHYIRFWDTGIGQQCGPPPLPCSEFQNPFTDGYRRISAVAYSPDGTMVAAGNGSVIYPSGESNKISLWDATTGARIKTLDYGANSTVVNSLAFPDNLHIIAGGTDGVKLIRISDSMVLNSSAETGELVISPNRQMVAIGYYAAPSSVVVLRSTTNLAFIRTIFTGGSGSGSNAIPLAFTPDNLRIAAVEAGPGTKLFDVNTGTLVFHLGFDGHTKVRGAFTPDGQYFIVGGGQNSVSVRNAANGTFIRSLPGYTSQINGISITPDGQYLFTTSNDGLIRIWQISAPNPADWVLVKTYDEEGGWNGNGFADPATLSPDGSRYFYGRFDATVVMANNPFVPASIQFNAPFYTVNENGMTAIITVTRTNSSSGAVAVNYATSDGTATAGQDYIFTAGTLNWADGDSSPRIFTVNIIDDNVFEVNETFNLALSNVTGNAMLGSPSTAVAAIIENETEPTLSINDVSLSEGNGGTTAFNFNVTLSGPTTQTVTLNYATADGTATAPGDYTAIPATQLTFNPGETSKQITVQVTGDLTEEANENFFVNLSGATNATIFDNQGIGTIINDDGALTTFTVSGQITNGGAPLNGVSVSLTGSSPVLPPSATTDANGNYQITVTPDNYTVRPILAGAAFSPPTRNVIVTNANVPNQNFSLAPCTYALSASDVNAPSAGTELSFGVTTTPECGWKESSNVPWIVPGTNYTGSGDGSADFVVQRNYGEARSGTISVNGQLLTVNQSAGQAPFGTKTEGGEPCPVHFTINNVIKTRQVVPFTGGSAGSFTVNTPANCQWSAVVDGSSPWLIVTAGAVGSGQAPVSISVFENTGSSSRIGTIHVNGQVYTVVQTARLEGCGMLLNPTSADFGPGIGNGSFNIMPQSGCRWSATKQASPWITLLVPTSGYGEFPFNYTITANTGTVARTGTIVVGNQAFTVNQAAGQTQDCSYQLSSAGQSFAAGSGAGSFTVTAGTGCQWTAVRAAEAPWITLTGGTGNGSGTVSFSLQANTGAARSGTVTVNNRTYTVTQASPQQACNYTISPGFQSVPLEGVAGNIQVAANGGCEWTAQSNVPWLRILSGAAGSGNGQVGFVALTNNTRLERIGTITAAGQIFTVTQDANPNVMSTRFDFDGDNKVDISIYRPSLGQWWINRSNAGLIVHTFGNSTDKITPADFTGDGLTDIAVWRPSNGEWFVLRSENSTFYSFPFGSNGDTPLPADFDGDNKADAAVFRPSNSTWYIQRSSGGTTIQQFGTAGDKPVVADYDGDGKSDIAIYRPSLGQWWLNRSSQGVLAVTFGNSTDKPVPGDYTGDGKADVAIWRPSNGEWFILRSENFTFYSFPFGTTGDMPVPGDYDGDGKTDSAVFRPSTNTWYLNRTTGGVAITNFGGAGDRPVPGAFIPADGSSGFFLTVNGTDNIHNNGEGTVPPFVTFPAGQNKVLNFMSVTGSVYATGPETAGGPEGHNNFNLGFTNVTAAGGRSGITYNGRTPMFLCGVFTSETPGSTPAGLIYTAGSNDNLTTYSPVLNQVFFIGDGLSGTGTGNVQSFNVPNGATRLYLGFADAFGYNGSPGAFFDNGGSLNTAFSINEVIPQ